MRGLLGKVVRRWESGSLSRSMLHWVDQIQGAKRMDMIRLKIVRRISERCLWVSFGTWCGKTFDLRRHRELIGRVLARMQGAATASALSTWASNVKEQHRLRASLARVVTRVLSRSLLRALETWHVHAVETRQGRHRAVHVLARLSNLRAARALDSWRESVAEMARRRELIAGCLRRWTLAALMEAFDGWVALAEGRVARSIMDVGTRTPGALFRAKSRAFGTLAQRAAQRRRGRFLLCRALLVRALRARSEAFDWWAAAVVATRHDRVALAHSMAQASAPRAPPRDRSARRGRAAWHQAKLHRSGAADCTARCGRMQSSPTASRTKSR